MGCGKVIPGSQARSEDSIRYLRRRDLLEKAPRAANSAIPSCISSRGQANVALKDRIILRYAGSHCVLVRHQPEVRNLGSHQTTKQLEFGVTPRFIGAVCSAQVVTLVMPARDSLP